MSGGAHARQGRRACSEGATAPLPAAPFEPFKASGTERACCAVLCCASAVLCRAVLCRATLRCVMLYSRTFLALEALGPAVAVAVHLKARPAVLPWEHRVARLCSGGGQGGKQRSSGSERTGRLHWRPQLASTCAERWVPGVRSSTQPPQHSQRQPAARGSQQPEAASSQPAASSQSQQPAASSTANEPAPAPQMRQQPAPAPEKWPLHTTTASTSRLSSVSPLVLPHGELSSAASLLPPLHAEQASTRHRQPWAPPAPLPPPPLLPGPPAAAGKGCSRVTSVPNLCQMGGWVGGTRPSCSVKYVSATRERQCWSRDAAPLSRRRACGARAHPPHPPTGCAAAGQTAARTPRGKPAPPGGRGTAVRRRPPGRRPAGRAAPGTRTPGGAGLSGGRRTSWSARGGGGLQGAGAHETLGTACLSLACLAIHRFAVHSIALH